MNLPRKVFIDTSFLIALLRSNDSDHTRVLALHQQLEVENVRKVTSEYVLLELGNSLARLRVRPLAMNFFRRLYQDRTIEVIPTSSEIFTQALTLFNTRSDKEWGLTDCTSFVIMRKFKIDTALTMDHHFQQAGFRALDGEGDAGEINIEAHQVTLTRRSLYCAANTKGTGKAGAIILKTDSLSLGFSEINTEAVYAGGESGGAAGGDITIQARDSLYLFDYSRISTEARGGKIMTMGVKLSLLNQSFQSLIKVLLLPLDTKEMVAILLSRRTTLLNQVIVI